MTNSRQQSQRPMQRRNHAVVHRSIDTNYSSCSDDDSDNEVETNGNDENHRNLSNSNNSQVIEILTK